MKVDVVDLSDGKKAGTADLDDDVFAASVRPDLVARMVRYQLDKARAGTHKVKGRSEVRRSNSKLYRQKGSGRARHGSRRVNLFRGGGVVFGPTVREHGHSLQKKVRRAALCSALSAKCRDGKLTVVKDFSWEGKTAQALQSLRFVGLDRHSALLVAPDDRLDGVRRSVGNLPGVDALSCVGVNVYDIILHDHLVLAEGVLEALTERLKRPIAR